MKRLISFLITIVSVLTMAAQGEQDFAQRFMSLYAKGTTLECTTISPLMLERMMQLPDVESSDATKQVLSQLKSIRMVSNSAVTETTKLYNKAVNLATRNGARYKPYADEQGKRLYVRRREKYIVEMVLFMKYDKRFRLINLTGNMTDDFLRQLLNI